MKIAIIGAGIAGLAAANTLYQNGIHDITIYEANSRIGGRINTVMIDQGYIELGAQWIHGQEENVLYEYAFEKDLVADPSYDYGVEGTGSFCNENGELVNCDLLTELINMLDEEKNMMHDAIEKKQNVHDYFKEKFDEFIESKTGECDLSVDTLALLKSGFRWFVLFELVDNSCDSLHELSALSYTEWKECEGVVDLINLKNGYASLLEQISSEFPVKDLVKLQTAVKQIDLYCPDKSMPNKIKVNLHTETVCAVDDDENENSLPAATESSKFEDEYTTFDHVILTSSIGFLKENLKNDFFNFDLPSKKVNVIRALGFGTTNKIFLHFETPFWFEEEKGFQILWLNVRDEHSYSATDEYGDDNDDEDNKNCKFPNWVYYIQGFDPVRGQPNLLLAWVSSIGAKQMEKYTDQQIGRTCGLVLRQVVPKLRQARPIEDPDKVYVSRWFSNRYIRGSYSNRSLSYQNLNLPDSDYNVDILAEPIRVENVCKISKLNKSSSTSESDQDQTSKMANFLNEIKYPLVLFAGEATDRDHYSTTDGAFRSGIREAKRLLDYHVAELTKPKLT